MLNEKQMIKFLKLNDWTHPSIKKLTKDEKKQIMEFAFGKEFMESNNKGSKVTYK